MGTTIVYTVLIDCTKFVQRLIKPYNQNNKFAVKADLADLNGPLPSVRPPVTLARERAKLYILNMRACKRGSCDSLLW